MRPSQIYISALLFCAATIAWPSFPEPAEVLEGARHLLEIRQQTTLTSTSKKSFDLSLSATASTSGGSASTTTTGSASTTNSQSGSVITGTATGNNTSKTTTSYSQTVFDARNGPGGISMMTPNPFSGASYYKIKDQVTFGWNYTSCSILPTAIDILAVASTTNVVQTFTIALNQSVSASTHAFTWDTGNYQATATDQLLTASYTLVVYDANKDVTATAAAGYLGTFNQFYFAMYSPGPSTTFEGFRCITCSGAMSSVEKQAYSVVFGMMAITVLSFTWFAGGAGLI